VRAIEARREWERRNGTGDFEGPEPEVAEVISPPRFTGWVWDPGRRIWSEWRDGVLIREIPAGGGRPSPPTPVGGLACFFPGSRSSPTFSRNNRHDRCR